MFVLRYSNLLNIKFKKIVLKINFKWVLDDKICKKNKEIEH